MLVRPQWGAVLLAVTLVAGPSACAPKPPPNLTSSCAIFDAQRGWYRDTERSYRRWGVPIHVQLAIVHQESKFIHNAKPPRKWRFLFILGPRPSSATGYAQATNETWESYIRSTGRRGADRDDFGDATDFIGWYGERSRRTCGISKQDAYSLYLAYHEGHGGYKRKSYLAKPWLMNVAARVRTRAETYRTQLARCEKRFKRKWWQRLLWPF